MTDMRYAHNLRGGLKVCIEDRHVLEAKWQGLSEAFNHGPCLVALAVGSAQDLSVCIVHQDLL